MTDHLDVLAAGRDCPQAAPGALLVPLRPGPLEDVELREEIELLLDVVATVTLYTHHLTAEQVDAALRLPARPHPPHRTDMGPTRKVDEPVLEATEACRGSGVDGEQGAAVPGVIGKLFEGEPESWDDSGNSCHRDVWTAMLSQLEAEPVPPTRQAVERLLTDTFFTVVGVDVSRDPLPEASRHVYRLHVTENQASSGVVDVEEWKHRLIPLLVGRAERAEPTP